MAARGSSWSSSKDHDHHQEGNIQCSSSLALLQERFNQLQKTREMRLERELIMMKLISDAATSTTMHYPPRPPPPPLSPTSSSSSTSSMASELMMFLHQQRPSFSGQPGFSGGQVAAVDSQHETAKSSSSSSSWLFGTNLGFHKDSSHKTTSSLIKFDDPCSTDVDTSLHL